VGEEQKKLESERRRERDRRIREYTATMEILKERGVKGLQTSDGVTAEASGLGPLQIFAEGDSWFDYPVPAFGGGIVPRLERRLGVPILNLAKAGDEVRFMLGVEERKTLAKQFTGGCPAGGPWDVLLFSGGGNDIVDNPMTLWVRDFSVGTPPARLIHEERFEKALGLVRAGYEDLITMRDSISPTTHLIFHGYDFAVPDGRGICHLGPWLKPTFDLRKFPADSPARFEVVKEMLRRFAAVLQSLATPGSVTFIHTQGTLAGQTSSWHNELHPSRSGYERMADLFHARLKELFPNRVL
jgi:hypothetical protein